MRLISQFATHFWSVGVWVVGYVIVGSIFSLLSEFKSQKGRCACWKGEECRVQSAV